MKPPLERKKNVNILCFWQKKENPRYGRKESVNSYEI